MLIGLFLRSVAVAHYAGAILSEALAGVYDAASKVRFEGARYRRDIGYRALEARKAVAD